MMRQSLRSFCKAQSGVAAIEFAIILPMMLILYFGLFDLTGLITNNRKITSVAAAVADLTAQNRTTVTKSQVDDYMNVADLIMKPVPDSGVTVRVFGFRKVSGVPTQQWTVNNGQGPGCANAPSTAGFNNLMTAGNDLVVAQVCMTYQPFIGTFLGEHLLGATSFSLVQQVVVRPRSTLTLACNNGGSNCT